MKITRLLSIVFITLFALATSALATGESRSGGNDRGDQTRERGAMDHDKGRGELNHDNELQEAQMSSEAEVRGATPIGQIRIGEPKGKYYSQVKDKLRDHR